MEYNLGKVLLTPKGEYNGSTTYEILDVVSYNGSSYAAKRDTSGNAPTGTTSDEYWQLMAHGGGTSTTVQIDGQSITNQGVANIQTINSDYNSSSNKIATASDLSDFISNPTNGSAGQVLKKNK